MNLSVENKSKVMVLPGLLPSFSPEFVSKFIRKYETEMT